MKNIEGPRKERGPKPMLQEEVRIEEPRNIPSPNTVNKDPKPEMGGKRNVTPVDINRDDSGIDYSGTT